MQFPFGPEAQAQAREAPMAESTYRSALASAPFTPAADWASSLEAQVPLPITYCRQCLRKIPASKAAKSVTAGTVVYLPDGNIVPKDSIIRDREVANGGHVNKGAYAHPGLALLESRCGHFVFVAPMTSFDGAGIQAKYTKLGEASKNNIFWRYLALDAHLLPPHNDLHALEIAGDKLPKPSYVHLEHGYWIERANVKVLGGHKRKLTFVKPGALKYAQWAYSVAEAHRQAWGLSSHVEIQKQQQPQCSAAGKMQDPSTSPAISTEMGRSQGALRIDQTFAAPQALGKDQPSWRANSSWTAVAGGAASGASWRQNYTPNTIPYAVGKSSASWRRGS